MKAQIRQNMAKWMVAGALAACLDCPQAAQAEDWADCFNQGNQLQIARRYREAITQFKRAIELGSGKPEVYKAYAGLSRCWGAIKEHDLAMANANKAIDFNPNYAYAYCSRGMAWGGKHEYDKAIADFNRAIAVDSNDADAYTTLAWLQATCPDARYRDGKKAFANASNAYQIDGGKDPIYIDTVAAAYAACSDFDAAREWENKAIAACTDEKLKQVFRSHLESYKQNKPWRAKPDEVWEL